MVRRGADVKRRSTKLRREVAVITLFAATIGSERQNFRRKTNLAEIIEHLTRYIILIHLPFQASYISKSGAYFNIISTYCNDVLKGFYK